MSLNDRLVSVVEAIGADIKSLFTNLSGKQDALISGTNIKTLNGNSLLGSGDISAGGNQITVSADAPASPTLNQLWLDIS